MHGANAPEGGHRSLPYDEWRSDFVDDVQMPWGRPSAIALEAVRCDRLVRMQTRLLPPNLVEHTQVVLPEHLPNRLVRVAPLDHPHRQVRQVMDAGEIGRRELDPIEIGAEPDVIRADP